MRIAIVDDLETERAQLKTRLARQLRLCGAEAELWAFESGESFLAAEKEQRFTAAFLDIYMHGMSGMDAAKELRKTDTDCLLVFTTTSNLLKPNGQILSFLLEQILSSLPRPCRLYCPCLVLAETIHLPNAPLALLLKLHF